MWQRYMGGAVAGAGLEGDVGAVREGQGFAVSAGGGAGQGGADLAARMVAVMVPALTAIIVKQDIQIPRCTSLPPLSASAPAGVKRVLT